MKFMHYQNDRAAGSLILSQYEGEGMGFTTEGAERDYLLSNYPGSLVPVVLIKK